MKNGVHQILKSDIQFLENFLLKSESQKTLNKIRENFGLPKDGFNFKNIQTLNSFYNGDLLRKFTLLGDDAKEEYQEFRMEISYSISSISKEILSHTKIEEGLLDKILTVYLFYNKIFIYPESAEVVEPAKEKPVVIEPTKIKENKNNYVQVYVPDKDLTLEEFKKVIIGENVSKYSEEEIIKYHQLAKGISNAFFHIWKEEKMSGK